MYVGFFAASTLGTLNQTAPLGRLSRLNHLDSFGFFGNREVSVDVSGGGGKVFGSVREYIQLGSRCWRPKEMNDFPF